MKPGRNDPCPCGSGKKYKRCCLAKELPPPVPLEWKRLRKAVDALNALLLRHASRRYGPETFAEAWAVFAHDCDDPIDSAFAPEAAGFFLPWMLFHWIPDAAGQAAPARPIAIDHLEQHGAQLNDLQRRFIEEACTQPFGFYLVTGVEPGRAISLRDLLLGGDREVLERSASKILRKGEILYASLVTVEGVCVLAGLAPIALPARGLLRIAELREELARDYTRLDREVLRERAARLRGVYFAQRDAHLNPRAPVLYNTDGDPLEPTTLHYTLHCSPREAFDALVSLSLSAPEDFLPDGEYDRRGNLRAIEFPWLKPGNAQHKGWDNTVLGHLRIREGKLVVEVNSQARAEAVREEIARCLGERARFRRAVLESAQRMLEKAVRAPAAAAKSKEPPEPELQALVQEFAERHWREWVDTPVPALEGATPREAARSPRLRPRLEALLLQLEYSDVAAPGMAPDVESLRRELGLI